jgi:invasion protein IalB
MSHQFKSLFVAALILAALPSFAQETPATPPETPAETPEVAADLDLGTPVEEAAPQPGQPYIREVFGDWSLRCLRAEAGEAEPCELYQLLQDADGNPVAEISLFPLPPGGDVAAGATIVAPLETLLTEQLTLSVDGAATRRYQFSFCNRAGCIARVGFTAEEVAQFKAGNAAQLRIVPAIAPDEEVVLDISLSGFTAGFEAGAIAP